MKYLVIKLIDFYQQFISFDKGLLSFLCPGGACKYSPTCSEYTKQKVLKYGLIKGLIKGVERISTCR